MLTYHVVGTPGSGKTTEMVSQVSQIVREGVSPQRICFTSFTKAAANEAKSRVAKALDVDPRKDLPLFGTLHSLAYRELALTKTQLFLTPAWHAFCKRYDYKTALHGRREEGFEEPDRSQFIGDYLSNFYSLLVNSLGRKPTKADIQKYVPIKDQIDLQVFIERYEAHKRELILFDFHDLLLQVLERGWVPDAEVCFIDESQDLTHLQSLIIQHWIRERDCVLAYDEDQAIYDWAGADPRWLLKLPGERKFLTQSHRLPKRLVEFSQRLIGRNVNRYDKKVVSEKEGGQINKQAELSAIIQEILRHPEKSWFLLARNRYLLKPFETALSESGILYKNLRGQDNRPHGAVVAYLKLVEGQSIDKVELQNLFGKVPSRGYFLHGAKTAFVKTNQDTFSLKDLVEGGANYRFMEAVQKGWLEPLSFPPMLLRTYKAMYKARGLKGLASNPTVTLSTIHGVKGMEADCVAIVPNHSLKTSLSDAESQRRVWYVGITRAKSELYILKPKPGYFFQELTRLPVADSVFGSCT